MRENIDSAIPLVNSHGNFRNRYLDALMSRRERPVDPNTPGGRIRLLRSALGWTQGDLARAAKIRQPSLSAIETGHTGELTSSSLMRICAALDTNPEFVLTGRGAPVPTTVLQSVDERDMLEAFRRLSHRNQLKVLERAQALYDEQPAAPAAAPKPAAEILPTGPRGRTRT